jgi:hypothetical protein
VETISRREFPGVTCRRRMNVKCVETIGEYSRLAGAARIGTGAPVHPAIAATETKALRTR